MRRLILLTFIFGAGIAGAAGPEAVPGPVKLPVPRLETLPNGLQLAWFVNDSLPVVDLALMIKSGNRDDEPGKSGTSELVSAALDRGAAGMSAQQIARTVEELGASRYASADEDTFTIGMHGLAPDAAVLLEMLSKMALHPDFPEGEVARERERMLDRWEHLSDEGESLAGLAYHRQLSAGTSYGRGAFLSAKEFAQVGRNDVAAYHKKHFTPKNAMLMIVGRVDAVEFRKQILKSMGTLEAWRGEAPARDWRNYVDKRLPTQKNAIVLVDRPDLTQAQVRIGFRAPLIQAPEHYALTVANALLGEYFNSRLNSLIRDKLGLTYGISSAFTYSKDLAAFTISSATRNETVGPLIHRTIEVLRDLKKGPLPSEEVRMAKEYLEGGFPLSTSTLSAVASRWLAGYVYDLGPEYLNEFIPRVNAVTTEAVIAAVMRDFPLDRLVITVAGDAGEISKSLSAARLKPVVRVSSKSLM